ncbi:MAG: hypothetical protein IKM83_02855, partial [Paludibacteraceae bacterium]|nr:hypothetical protein [Paludibacteraceae bacterium]
MTAKFPDIMAALKAGTYAPIYVLCGEEPYYMDRVYEFIAENALDEMAREFDQQIVYGRDLQGADIAPVISAARGYAMMGGRKVVIVREAQTIKKWEALEAYLSAIMPQTVLVICYNGKPDKRQNIWKKVAEHPQVLWMQSDKLRDYEVERWISAYSAVLPGVDLTLDLVQIVMHAGCFQLALVLVKQLRGVVAGVKVTGILIVHSGDVGDHVGHLGSIQHKAQILRQVCFAVN